MWRLYPEEGCYDTRWLTGFWSTQAKVEGTVPKAAWHYGRDSSVVKEPLWEPCHTPLYVGLPSAWGSVGGDLTFSPYVCRGALFWGLRLTHMNKYTRGYGDAVSVSTGTLLGDMEGASLPGSLREK